jgi:glycosyltransferase involved in cell wall biosynthesis
VSGVIEPSRRTAGARIVLLTPLPAQPELDHLVRHDQAPRRDFAELAETLGAHVVDAGWVAADPDRVVRLTQARLGAAGAQVMWAYRHRHEYDVCYSDAERVGIPLAAMFKLSRARTGHVMLAHWLSPREKALPLRLLRLHTHIDRIVCRIEHQRYVAERLGVPPERLVVIAKGVDHQFWRPLPEVDVEDLICTAGLEQRDYGTLIEALRGTELQAVLAAASPYFRESGLAAALPANATVGRFDYPGLRSLYARSRFVVMPLLDVDFQAGITTVLEAMAMGKAIVLTRTRGMVSAGLIRHGEEGLYVRPGDPAALREALIHLWENPADAERMGRRGRAAIEERFTLEHLVGGLASVLRAVAATTRGGTSGDSGLIGSLRP